ncbi:MAG: phenylacetate--CoA ligase family protein [Jiangellaceae bacterium]
MTTALTTYREICAPNVLETVRRAAGRVPALDSRLAEAGLDPAGSVALADLDAVRVLSKDQLPALQRERPPFGGLIADDASVVRVFSSPGPIYEAQLAGADPWRWAPALQACGIGPGDIALNCFSYHLSPAGAMFDEAARAVGATVIPAGVGAAEVQVQVIADLAVTAYIGLPSYLGALGDRFDTSGLAADRWRISKAFVTAEPLPDSLRAELTTRVPTVLMGYGTAEVGLIGFERSPGGGLGLPPSVYVQICDPETGREVDGDQPGEVVVTLLDGHSPMVRFGTGDVSRWMLGPDGSLRLAGVLGRVGAAVKVRGMFIHPHQAREVIAGLAGRGVKAGRFLVERTHDRDVLTLELVADDGAAQVVEAAADQTRAVLRVRPDVRLVDELDGDAVLVDARRWE